jgi:hypothetical protein
MARYANIATMDTGQHRIAAIEDVRRIMCRVDNVQYITAKRILRDYSALSAALEWVACDESRAEAEAVAALVRLHKYLD